MIVIESFIKKLLVVLISLTISSLYVFGVLSQALPDGLPLDIEGYTQWTRLNKKVLRPRTADPHSGYKRLYVNKKPYELLTRKKKQIFPYPEGTIIVKEVKRTADVNSDIILISIMRKLPGNETTGGWDFVEYSRFSGDTFTQIQFPKESCYACHQGASKTDAVWTRFTNFRK